MYLGKAISFIGTGIDKPISCVSVELSSNLKIEPRSVLDGRVELFVPYRGDKRDYLLFYLGEPYDQSRNFDNRVTLRGLKFHRSSGSMGYSTEIFTIDKYIGLCYFLWIDKRHRVFLEVLSLNSAKRQSLESLLIGIV